MVTLSFVLAPENCIRLHDALNCLSKFSDSISIEARESQLALTALNSSKSAHASFIFYASDFFSQYEYIPDVRQRINPFTISLVNKALMSIFKGRFTDTRGRDTAIQRCEVSILDRPNRVECRFVVKMVCRHGVTKRYKLTYEPVELMHALFDKHRATNHWSIPGRQLRDLTEYFAPKTEQLDIYSDGGKMILTSYTEKIVNGREILKQPLQTSVAIDVLDFEEFNVTEKLHITIGVKDFKNIVLHADTLRSSVKVMYSQPARPLQITYGDQGVYCEFTLMTIGDFQPMAGPNISRNLSHEKQRPHPSNRLQQQHSRIRSDISPTNATNNALDQFEISDINSDSSRKDIRSVGRDVEALFVPHDEDDSRWDPSEPQHDDDNDVLGWDASANNDVSFTPLLRDSGTSTRPQTFHQDRTSEAYIIAPTQRASQVRGLFD